MKHRLVRGYLILYRRSQWCRETLRFLITSLDALRAGCVHRATEDQVETYVLSPPKSWALANPVVDLHNSDQCVRMK
jgi:hypothetical protein